MTIDRRLRWKLIGRPILGLDERHVLGLMVGALSALHHDVTHGDDIGDAFGETLSTHEGNALLGYLLFAVYRSLKFNADHAATTPEEILQLWGRQAAGVDA